MNYRRFESSDRMPVYRMFREVLWDYMLQNGLAGPDDGYELDEFFSQQQKLYVHLEENASEDWVAENDQNQIVGWARSIERDGHLQLTHFFISTSAQGGGIARALLDRAFPLNRGRQRSIIATPNPRALSLYLKYQVNFQSTAFVFSGRPRPRQLESDLEIALVPACADTMQAVLGIEREILGYQRPAELEFFMTQQPIFLFHRDAKLVGYAFGYGNHSTGPAAALSTEDMPVLLQCIEQSAIEADVESLWFTIPSVSQHAVRWALQAGYQMDPFHEYLLADDASIKLDRYLLTQSTFVW